jgi:GxxExxY protein
MGGTDLVFGELTERILDAAGEVHRCLGAGRLESAYRACLVRQLRRNELVVDCEVPIPIEFNDIRIDGAFRADMIVERKVLVELKSVERLLPIHEAQVLTYLKLSKLKIGLLLNFNSTHLRSGVRRFIR